jgi:hypothetical protein
MAETANPNAREAAPVNLGEKLEREQEEREFESNSRVTTSASRRATRS